MKIGLTLEGYTRFAIAFFMVTFIGMYYGEYLNFIWIGYFLLAIAIALNMLNYSICKIYGWQYILLTICFIIYGYISLLWSYDIAVSTEYLMQTVKVVTLALMLTLLLNSKERVNFSLFWFSVGCVIFALLYLQHVNLAELGRSRLTVSDSSGSLPNYNLVSMYAAFAGIYFMGNLINAKSLNKFKKNATIILMMATLISVFVMGSRKSILMVALGILYFILNSGSIASRMKILIGILIAMIIISMILPDAYIDYVFSRFSGLLENKSSRLESGDKERVKLLEYGLRLIEENPLIGHGYYSFSPLYQSYTGNFLYAHNNYVELIADLGIIGLALFYYPIVVSFRISLKYRKVSSLMNILFVLSALALFGGIFIVLFIDRTVWILTSIIYVGTKLEQRSLIFQSKHNIHNTYQLQYR